MSGKPPDRPTPLPLPTPQVPRDVEDPFANVPSSAALPKDPRTITGVYETVESQWAMVKKLLVLVGVVGAGLLAVAAVASDRTDAGVKNTNIRLEQLEVAHKNHLEDEHEEKLRTRRALDRQDEQQQVINQKLNLVLDKLKVEEWKRPAELPPKDGGL